MSQAAVTKIIGRALAEPKFRRLLETDPNKALAGFDLTQDEVNLIRSSLQAGLGPGASELESRVSRARLPLDVLSGAIDSLSAQADGFPTADPSFGTLSFGGKEGVGSLGSGPTAGGTGASQVFPGAGTSDLGHGVVGTGPHEWGSGSSEPGTDEIPEPDGALNLGPDFGPDLIEGEAGSAPAGGAELGEGEMPQGVLPSGVDDHSGDGVETGVTNTMGEDDESGAIDIHGEGGGGPDAAETGGKGTGPGGETGATETGPDFGASEVEGGMGPAQPAGAQTGGGNEGGVVDIQGEGGGETGAGVTGASDAGPGGETGATETGPGMGDGGASEAEGGMGPAQPAGSETGGDTGGGGEGGVIDIQGEGGGETGATETGTGNTGPGGETGATETGSGGDYGASEAEGGMGPAQPEGSETGSGVLDMGGLGSFYGGESTDSGSGGSEGSDGSDHDGSGGGGDDSGGSGDTGSSDGGGDDDGDDDGGDDDDEDGDEGSDEDTGSTDGYSVDGGADAGSRPGHGAMPIGAGTARATGGLSGGGERDDSGQERVILGGGTGGGEPGTDDTGREQPGIAGAVPTRQASPELAPLYDPVENQASVDSDAAVKADANPEAGNLAAAADNLSISKDQGGELADQAENEAKV
jgi:hypothetical protein